MYVGTLSFDLLLGDVRSLKEKRSVVRPIVAELRRAYAEAAEEPDPAPLGAPATATMLRLLAARETEPARGLEAFAACGVRWLIEQFLRPDRTDPDPEARCLRPEPASRLSPWRPCGPGSRSWRGRWRRARACGCGRRRG